MTAAASATLRITQSIMEFYEATLSVYGIILTESILDISRFPSDRRLRVDEDIEDEPGRLWLLVNQPDLHRNAVSIIGKLS